MATNKFVARNGIVALDNSTITGSLNVTNGITGSLQGTSSYSINALSASYSANAELLDGRDSLTFANTGSNLFVGQQNINGSVAVTGSLTTTGTITAQTLNVQQVTSSVIYSSGSNVFGNSLSNTQVMTGSVGISGSLAVNGNASITGNLGFGGTATSKIHIITTGGAGSGLLTELTNSSSYATTDWKNNVGAYVQLLVTGTSFTSGIFKSSYAYFNSETSGGAGIIASSATGNIVLGAGGSLDANIRQMIFANGNISMGWNTDQGFKLAVNGSLYAVGQLRLGSTITNGTYIYTLPSATGILALTSNITSAISGTTNFIPKFTGANTIGNSIVQENASGIGIGTSPTAGLELYTFTDPNLVIRTFGDFNVHFRGQTNGLTQLFSIRNNSTNAVHLNTQNGVPLAFGVSASITGGTTVQQMLLNASGNLGLGVTPSAWSNAFGSVMQFKSAGSSGGGALAGSSGGNFRMFSNAFYDGSYKYISNGPAAQYEQDGYHAWYSAPSGTAGNAITFTQAMTLTAAGRLLINKTDESTYHLDVNGTGRFTGTGAGGDNYILSSIYNNPGGAVALIQNTNSSGWSIIRFLNDSGTRMGSVGSGNSGAFVLSNSMYITSQNNFPLLLGTGTGAVPSERMRITPDGRVLIGTPPPTESTFTLDVNGTGRFSGDLSANSISTIVPTGNTAIFTLKSGSGESYISETDGNLNMLFVNKSTLNVGAGVSDIRFCTNNNTTTPALILGVTGAATFSSSVTATSLTSTIGVIEIQGSANAIKTFYLNRYGVSSGSQHRLRAQNGYFEIASANSEPIVLTGGNVGIGTTSPAAKLNIVGGIGEVIRLESSPFDAVSGNGPALTFQLTQSNGQSAQLGLIKANADTNWGGILTFNTKENNGTPNNTTTERMRITSDGYVRLASGTGGIQFNGDTSAANSLDDYEEGTFTPSMTFGGASVGITYFDRVGNYTKIGRQVTCTIYLALTAIGTSTGNAILTGLPFTVSNANRGTATVGNIRFNNITYTGQLITNGDSNGAIMNFQQITEAGTASALTNTNFNSSSEMWIAVTYFV